MSCHFEIELWIINVRPLDAYSSLERDKQTSLGSTVECRSLRTGTTTVSASTVAALEDEARVIVA